VPIAGCGPAAAAAYPAARPQAFLRSIIFGWLGDESDLQCAHCAPLPHLASFHCVVWSARRHFHGWFL
jgi:hypothetical protein